MKNWKVIMWLILFFPVGLYLMYKQTDWSKPVKYGLTGFYTIALVFGGLEVWPYLMFLSSFLVVVLGLFYLFRKRSRRKGIGILVLGLLLFSVSGPVIGAQTAEQERIEQQEQEAKAEAEHLAEEKRLAEIARQEEQERIEKEEALKEEILEAIKKVEETPTQRNYNKAEKLLRELEEEDADLSARLDKTLAAVEEYEEELAAATEVVEKAEDEKDRTTYEEAYALVSDLSVANGRLERCLTSLDNELAEIEEEERLAAEKAEEEKKQAAEEAAEEERKIAAAEEAEEAQKQAEAQTQQKSQQQAPQNSSPSPPKEEAPVEATQSDQVETTVYIAPQSGTKYHYSANCRGLNNANSIQEMSLSDAESQGYELCGFE